MHDANPFASLIVPVDGLNTGHAVMGSLVEAALRALQQSDSNELHRSLAQLLTVSHSHFLEEESLMRRVEYPHAFDHAARHQQLLHGLTKLQRVQFTAVKTPDFMQAFGAYLSSWHGTHLRRDDAAFGQFLAALERTHPGLGDSGTSH